MELTKRRLLAATAVGGAAMLAGCAGVTGDAGDESGEITAQSSFFVFGALTAQVAGAAADADLLVPVGQHGHGWEPGPSVREDIHDADLLVHGMQSFQPWVDDILGDLDSDGADVVTVDAAADVDLLGLDEAHHGHDEETHTDDHGEETHTDDHDEETHTDDQDGDGGHDDHEGTDPHFWMDPVRLQTAVGTVEDAFIDLDSENESAYAETAEAYRTELEDLHQRIESTVADAAADVILVAGHNSFRYLGDRYGLHVEALTNVSPDDRPTTRDIERAQEVIETHELQYICADPLESQAAAEQLVEETDAEAVLPLTAMPGLTDEWQEQDWGYVEVMENVTRPTLERALQE